MLNTGEIQYRWTQIHHGRESFYKTALLTLLHELREVNDEGNFNASLGSIVPRNDAECVSVSKS